MLDRGPDLAAGGVAATDIGRHRLSPRLRPLQMGTMIRLARMARLAAERYAVSAQTPLAVLPASRSSSSWPPSCAAAWVTCQVRIRPWARSMPTWSCRVRGTVAKGRADHGPARSRSSSSSGITGALRRAMRGFLPSHRHRPHTEFLTVPGGRHHIVVGAHGLATAIAHQPPPPEHQARGQPVPAGNVADRHAGLHHLLDDRRLRLSGKAPPTGDAGDHLDPRKRFGHRRSPRSVPGSSGKGRSPVETGSSS